MDPSISSWDSSSFALTADFVLSNHISISRCHSQAASMAALLGAIFPRRSSTSDGIQPFAHLQRVGLVQPLRGSRLPKNAPKATKQGKKATYSNLFGTTTQHKSPPLHSTFAHIYSPYDQKDGSKSGLFTLFCGFLGVFWQPRTSRRLNQTYPMTGRERQIVML